MDLTGSQSGLPNNSGEFVLPHLNLPIVRIASQRQIWRTEVVGGPTRPEGTGGGGVVPGRRQQKNKNVMQCNVI